MMILDEKFSLGEIVYLNTDIEQYPRCVTGYKIRPGGLIIYMLSCEGEETSHYDIEITKEKNQNLKLTS